MSYSVDFRRHVLTIREKEGLTFDVAAARFSVGVASLERWSKRLAPKRYERRKVRKIDLDALARDVREYPDAYQYERAARFGVCRKAIWQALRKLGVTYQSEADQETVRGTVFPPNAGAPEGGRRRAACLPGEDQGA